MLPRLLALALAAAPAAPATDTLPTVPASCVLSRSIGIVRGPDTLELTRKPRTARNAPSGWRPLVKGDTLRARIIRGEPAPKLVVGRAISQSQRCARYQPAARGAP
jgi:hypothetical protein